MSAAATGDMLNLPAQCGWRGPRRALAEIQIKNIDPIP